MLSWSSRLIGEKGRLRKLFGSTACVLFGVPRPRRRRDIQSPSNSQRFSNHHRFHPVTSHDLIAGRIRYRVWNAKRREAFGKEEAAAMPCSCPSLGNSRKIQRFAAPFAGVSPRFRHSCQAACTAAPHSIGRGAKMPHPPAFGVQESLNTFGA